MNATVDRTGPVSGGAAIVESFTAAGGRALIRAVARTSRGRGAAGDTMLPDGAVFAGGTKLPDGAVLAGGTNLPDGAVLAGGTNVDAGGGLRPSTARAGGVVACGATESLFDAGALAFATTAGVAVGTTAGAAGVVAIGAGGFVVRLGGATGTDTAVKDISVGTVPAGQVTGILWAGATIVTRSTPGPGSRTMLSICEVATRKVAPDAWLLT